MNCPICGKELKTWYSLGGKTFLGCSDIKCNYKEEIEAKGR
jgi:ssDNA-binding Zn-finger/Zn-ribbon topoisomerase 1